MDRAYLLDISNVEVERAGSVNNCLEWRVRNDGLVKSTLLGDILHDGKVKLVRAIARVSTPDLLGLLSRANGGDDAVATLQKNVENVCGNEARASSE